MEKSLLFLLEITLNWLARCCCLFGELKLLALSSGTLLRAGSGSGRTLATARSAGGFLGLMKLVVVCRMLCDKFAIGTLESQPKTPASVKI
jgi:hypothetical protein